MKIKINITGFGDRFCLSNVEYKLSSSVDCYVFYKKGTEIHHNEYGPAYEDKNGSYGYYINDKLHRLNYYAYYGKSIKYKIYYVIGKYAGNTKEEFIKYLANILIPI